MILSIDDAAGIVERGIAELPIPGEPAELYNPIRYILSIGGKRLRPSLVLVSCNLFTDKLQQAIPVALAVEVFHNFTLLHDDIMDKAPLRRNKPAVHEKWGENTAILSGDVMSILTYKILQDLPAGKLKTVLAIFNQTAIQVCEGQQQDMNFETRDDVRVEEYIEMIGRKTAVLIAACLQMGAVMGGSSLSDARNLFEFGHQLGIAFQLRDDWLDVYGHQEKVGKMIGGDIVANKKTFLLIRAIELADEETLEDLRNLMLQKHKKADEKVRRVKGIFDRLNVSAMARDQMENYYQKALHHLDQVSVPQARKRVLRQFAKNLMGRDY